PEHESAVAVAAPNSNRKGPPPPPLPRAVVCTRANPGAGVGATAGTTDGVAPGGGGTLQSGAPPFVRELTVGVETSKQLITVASQKTSGMHAPSASKPPAQTSAPVDT